MKRTSLLITLLIFLAGITTEVKATHAAGGELIYQWIGGSTYRITFKFYRDCAGIAAPNPQMICAYNTCTNQILSNSVVPPQFYPGTNIPNGSPVSAGCGGYGTICNGGTLPGYEEWWYVCDFTLPTQCTNWTFYTAINARNNQIDNLGNSPGSLNIFIYATLNNILAQGNSSPFFTVKPVPYTCVNMPFTYNNGAVDPDGDSLSFEFVYPSNGATGCGVPNPTAIIFAPTVGVNNFNINNNPFATNNTFSFNTYTGEMTFIPSTQSENVVTVKVHEYRNGQEIGTVLRDIQLNIRVCNVPAPSVLLDTNTVVGAFTNGQIEVCVGHPVHFCFDAMTLPGRVLVLSDNHSYISNNITMSYSNQGTDTVTGCFDWLPGINDTGLHIFVVNVKDSTCDFTGISVTTTLTVPIRVWPAIDIVLAGDSNICVGQSATLYAIGGGNSYNWTAMPGGSGNGSINCLTCDTVVVTPTVTTTYAVTSTSTHGCPDTSYATIHVGATPVANAGNDTTVCGGTSVQLHGSGGTNYHWYPSTGLSNPLISNPVYTGVSTMTFTLVVSNTGSCTDTDQVVITMSPQVIANAGPDINNCTNAMVQLQGSGGGNYSWTPAAALNNSHISNPTMVVNDTIITFTLIVSNNQGCSDTDQVTVSVHQAVAQVNAGPDISACSGSVVQLQGSGNGTFLWTGGSVSNTTISNPYYTGLSSATLTLTVTDSYNCTASDQVVVTLSPQPVANAGPDVNQCNNAPVQLQGSGGTTIVWTPAWPLTNNTIYNPVMNVTDTTVTFTMIVTNSQGCSDTDQVTISIHQGIAQANAGPDVSVCPGSVVQLQGSGNGSFLWTGSVSNNTISNPFYTGTTSSTVTLVVTDMYNCTDTDQALVTVNPQPVANAGPDINNCTNAMVQLNGSGGGTYNWTPTAALNNNTLSNPTMVVNDTIITFTMVVTNGFGCKDTDQVNVSVHQAIAQSNAGPDTAICSGSPLQMQGSGNGTFLWSGSVSNFTISNPMYIGNSTSTLSLIVTDIYNCTDTDQVVVTVNPNPVANAGPDVNECTNAPVQLNGSGGNSVMWTPSWPLNNNTIYNPVMNVTDTTVTFTMIVTNTQGCSDSDDVTISIHQRIAVSDAGPDTSICPGSVLQLQGTGNGSFAWTGSVSDPTIGNPNYTGTTSSTLTLTVTDIYSCTDTDTVQVTMLPQPTALAGPDSAVCLDATITMWASGGMAYNWFPNTGMSNGNTSTPTVIVNGPIVYYAVVSNIEGCTDTATVSLSIVPAPTFAASSSQDICLSDSVKLFASGGSSYQWYPNEYILATNGDSVLVWPPVNTTYYVVITESTCNYQDTIAVPVNIRTLPEVTITRNDPLRCGLTYGQLEASGAMSYRWVPADKLDDANVANPKAYVKAETWFYVTGTDEFGCESSDSAMIRIATDKVDGLFVPTVFSPNADGKNDCYRIIQPMGITEYELHIYNRFGQNVHTADDASDCWDGTFKGRLCDVGVYYYYYKFKSPLCGTAIEGKGDITLVR